MLKRASSPTETNRRLPQRLLYGFLRIVCQILALTLWRFRRAGQEHVPQTGPAVLLSNHQSFFDPVFVGLSCRRQLNYLARADVFGIPVLGRLIAALGAIPIERDRTGIGGLKRTLRQLSRGELVLLFPEGTRSSDGEITPLKPGFSVLVRRAKVPLVPVGIDGAFDAWPRSRRFPRPGRIWVQFGEPLSAEEVANLSVDDLVGEIERRIRACHSLARERNGRR